MAFKPYELPWPKDALAPHISRETIELHHDRHHATYVKNLNALLDKEPSLAGKSLADIVRTAPPGPLFNNAGQAFNHDLYWQSLSPQGGGDPRGAVADAIRASFGGFGDFKEQFSKAAVSHFASGWAWLVKDGSRLAVLTTHDAQSPIRDGVTPLLCCDVWEHAYYVDYRNERAKYVEAFWNIVNWELANRILGS
jgi:superoxide dismutase, Fe-Mn family